ncbi:MAG: hypothetical protein SWX82_28765 [Cyanobacteriota bacterium]|nr:hypothetical protein [Cyanobacteriota bacterium]
MSRSQKFEVRSQKLKDVGWVDRGNPTNCLNRTYIKSGSIGVIRWGVGEMGTHP